MRKAFQTLTLLALFLLPGAILAQEESSGLKSEFGFWLGASNPVPASQTDQILDTTIGAGLFYRLQWPWFFQTELGGSYSNYTSRSSQSLVVAPLYAALVYRLPLPYQLQTFLKVGGGSAWLEVYPVKRWGWDPLFFAGLEFSILVGRKVRIGARFDYNLIYEKHLKPPPEVELLRYLGAQDPRFKIADDFRIRNGAFYHFGLMLSFKL